MILGSISVLRWWSDAGTGFIREVVDAPVLSMFKEAFGLNIMLYFVQPSSGPAIKTS